MAGPPQIIPDENALTVFTDRSSLPAPRRGGIGVHFVHTDAVGNERAGGASTRSSDAAPRQDLFADTARIRDERGYAEAVTRAEGLRRAIVGANATAKRRPRPTTRARTRCFGIFSKKL